MTVDKTAIRDAATVIVVRDRAHSPKVLMGQRGASAAFMPNKFVFPGGAVDRGDAAIPLASALLPLCHARLNEDTASEIATALAVAAIRELWEETGLILGHKSDWLDAPEDWQGFAQLGYRPAAEALQFVFRAVTPPKRPRRFDARFFLINAEEIASDLDDFSAACDELSQLQWIPLDQVRTFDLPFITEVVLAEIESRLHDSAPPASIPYFKNEDEQNLFVRLNGTAPSPSH